MLLPGTMPTFVANETNVTHLQQLSSAVAFLGVAGNEPSFRFVKSASASLTGGSWQTIPYNTVQYDPDNMHNAATGGIQVNTQGYYRLEACLEIEGPAANDTLSLSFFLTVGPNNPNFSNGTTLRFGGCGDAVSSGSNDWSFVIADVVPIVLYPNDQILVQCFPGGTTITDTLTNSAATAGWFSPQFSGRWIRQGT
jgi:hypothetical protein